MTPSIDIGHWRSRLAALADEFEVPGASLAFSHERAETLACATGVLNRSTAAPVSVDSLFQIGSITKVWTTTQLMLLIEQGRLTLETPVAGVLPEFAVRDTRATRAVTVRQLLTHTSGIDGDLFVDTGRGGDCLRRYVEACAGLDQLFSPGAGQSYCNAGFVIAGRIVERLTGLEWDEALKAQIIEPLGLTHTCTLPEDALRFATALGHGDDGAPADVWGLPRSMGPAGLVCARAKDVVAFGRAHLTPGALLADPQALRVPQVRVPNPYVDAEQWGLGWGLTSWDGRQVAFHGGDTIGQHAMLWVLPATDTVVALLTNGGRACEFQHAVASELFQELAGVTVPAPLTPPTQPVAVDTERFAGVYERAGSRITATVHAGALRLRTEPTGALEGLAPVREFTLTAVDENTFLARHDQASLWDAVVFETAPDGTSFLRYSGRATPKAR
ncbi:serine hydrolase domain-containing protein [Streptomyces sp. NPDC057302]|uniref:serine hydrolase domain-containing protein n=1 Tax=Streptomyces sp. NPDC057302 TaxID=3346094 RepID=UPI003626D365